MGFYELVVSKQAGLGSTYLALKHCFTFKIQTSDDKISAEVGLLAEDSQEDFMSLCYH